MGIVQLETREKDEQREELHRKLDQAGFDNLWALKELILVIWEELSLIQHGLIQHGRGKARDLLYPEHVNERAVSIYQRLAVIFEPSEATLKDREVAKLKAENEILRQRLAAQEER